MMEDKPQPKSLHQKKQYDLIKEIFDSPNPELMARSLPAQSIYAACLKAGLSSSVELVNLASQEQIRILLDFDLWQKDRIDEDKFWQWLELPDAANDLLILQKTLQALDLKIVSFLIAQYVYVITHEEPTETPPEQSFYTPDKGYTWLRVQTEDETKDFLFKRLLALIFETDTDLFYKLLSIPGVSTSSMLEEESYQEKQKRLAAEGIPEREDAQRIHSPLEIGAIITQLREQRKQSDKTVELKDIRAIRPLVYDRSIPSPLRELISALHSPEEFETELTLLLNSGFVHWSIDFSDAYQTEALVGFIRGAINISLEKLQAATELSVGELYEALGLQTLYSAGLGVLLTIKDKALKVGDTDEQDATEKTILHGLRQTFPVVPNFLDKDGSVLTEDGKLAGGFRPLENDSLVLWLQEFLKNHSSH